MCVQYVVYALSCFCEKSIFNLMLCYRFAQINKHKNNHCSAKSVHEIMQLQTVLVSGVGRISTVGDLLFVYHKQKRE